MQAMPECSRPSSLLLAVCLAACAGAPRHAPRSSAEASVEASADSAPQAWRSPLHRDHPLVGRIFAVSTGTQIDRAALMAALAAAQVVVLGEQHDNQDHHLLQADAIAELDARRGVSAVVFEQIRLPQQAAIDALGALSPGEVDRLSATLVWKDSGWPPFAYYRPVFEASLRAGAQLRAGSLSREQTMAASQQGAAALPPALVARFGLDRPPAPAEAQALREDMQQAHCGMLPEAMLDGMVLVQRARDATLAQAILDAGPAGSVLVAGNGHARTDRGVPRYLRSAATDSVRSLAWLEVRPGQERVEEYAQAFDAQQLPFDFVWFTPVDNETDHCAELRARFHHAPAGD